VADAKGGQRSLVAVLKFAVVEPARLLSDESAGNARLAIVWDGRGSICRPVASRRNECLAATQGFIQL